MREFANQMAGERAGESSEFYRGLGVVHESWHLQQTPAGPLVIVVTEIAEAEVKLENAASAYATSQRPFDRWFKDRVFYLTGVSPDRDPLGPPTTSIFEFDRRG
jgi:hypothetical protein